MAQQLTPQEQQLYDYIVAMHMDEDGCNREDAEARASFDIEAARSIKQ